MPTKSHIDKNRHCNDTLENHMNQTYCLVYTYIPNNCIDHTDLLDFYNTFCRRI